MKRILVIVVAATVVFSCNKRNNEIHKISSDGKAAESVYLTHDNLGKPVVAWTERNETQISFVYEISPDDGKSFSDRVEVPLDEQVATHAEGMPKVAFKKDGTVVVAYEKKASTKDNKYAGAVCYRVSKDNGKTWSAEQFLHSDTIPGRSRSYFDIETLPDGEIGASWLDIKLDHSTGGRSVRFAKTNSDNEFTHEILVDSSVCQCCRTEVYADANGKVNIAYRGLKKGTMGQSIRDMMIATSVNNGIVFTSPIRISADNWNIDGCPHTGPALCSSKGTLQAFWYTEGSGAGIYYAHRENGDSDFASRQLLSSVGRHPQACSNDNAVAIVWEENIGEEGKPVTRIRYRINNGQHVTKAILSPASCNAFLPVITQTKRGFVVAFIMERNGETGTYVKHL
jgi:hypothetical protein